MMSSSRGDDTRLAITAVRDAVAVLKLLSDPDGVKSLMEQLQSAYDSTLAGIEAAENHLKQRQEEIRLLEEERATQEDLLQKRVEALAANEQRLVARTTDFNARCRQQVDELTAQRYTHQQDIDAFETRVAEWERENSARLVEFDKGTKDLTDHAYTLYKREEAIKQQEEYLGSAQARCNEWEVRLGLKEQGLEDREQSLLTNETAYTQRVKHLRGMLAEAESPDAG